MFQFLLGRLKTFYRIWGISECRKFQFLLGRLKTITGRKRNQAFMGVSIPLRQAKNPTPPLSPTHYPWVSIPLRQAKNRIGNGSMFIIDGFQFLLGRLKTFLAFPSHQPLFLVSIPLRQAKNPTPPRVLIACFNVSIPLRQAKNANSMIIHAPYFVGFNSS